MGSGARFLGVKKHILPQEAGHKISFPSPFLCVQGLCLPHLYNELEMARRGAGGHRAVWQGPRVLPVAPQASVSVVGCGFTGETQARSRLSFSFLAPSTRLGRKSHLLCLGTFSAPWGPRDLTSGALGLETPWTVLRD